MKRILLNLRALGRLTRVAIHLVAGAAIVGLIYPLIGTKSRRDIKQRWSRQLLDMFGVELAVSGATTGAMRVANHVSWLDIFVINAVSPAVFIAKHDVRSWPLIGWMSSKAGTLYIRRGSRRAAHEASLELTACLKNGIEVVAFPEGTTSDGREVLPFHGALLQGAIAAGVPIQPVALSYATRDERPAQAPVYCGETSLITSMWRVAVANDLTVRLEFLARRDATSYERRELAMQLRDDIRAVMPPLLPQDRSTAAA